MPKAPQPPKSKKLPRKLPDDPVSRAVHIMREATGDTKSTGPSGRPAKGKAAKA